MKRSTRRAVYAGFIFFAVLTGAIVAVLGNATTSYQPYPQQISEALTWMASTPNGTGFVSVDDSSFASLNFSYPGDHWVYYNPYDTAGPFTASFDAASRHAHYLIVTSNLPSVFEEFTSSSLDGAPLVWSSADIHIFEVGYPSS